MDYLAYYDLERYLFGAVTDRYQREGFLNAFDFFSIVIWKANRAKSLMARRMLGNGHPSLEDAVGALTRAVHQAPTGEARFMVLVRDWAFRLPMASAVLTVLHPNDFTVYDVRACDALGGYHGIGGRTDPRTLWAGYCEFRKAVRAAAPQGLSLRDQDRFLWARSAAEQLRNDLVSSFTAKETGGRGVADN